MADSPTTTGESFIVDNLLIKISLFDTSQVSRRLSTRRSRDHRFATVTPLLLVTAYVPLCI